VTSADQPAKGLGAAHYCIASAFELWFERLDFDQFWRSGPCASKVHATAVCQAADRTAWFAIRRNASGI
jgi:hypothetical protein